MYRFLVSVSLFCVFFLISLCIVCAAQLIPTSTPRCIYICMLGVTSISLGIILVDHCVHGIENWIRERLAAGVTS